MNNLPALKKEYNIEADIIANSLPSSGVSCDTCGSAIKEPMTLF